MNIHHLELFYHVARHGGISAATRKMPYGIQQPAVSSQILQLEEALGTTLFVRRPFELTAAGRMLYGFIRPFFGGLDEMAQRLRSGAVERLGIAAPDIVQREYLPDLFARMKLRVPDFQFTLRQQGETAENNDGGEFTISIEVLSGRPEAGRQFRELGLEPIPPASHPCRPGN